MMQIYDNKGIFNFNRWDSDCYQSDACKNTLVSFGDELAKTDYRYRHHTQNNSSTFNWYSGKWLDKWYGVWLNGERVTVMTMQDHDGNLQSMDNSFWHSVLEIGKGEVAAEHDYWPTFEAQKAMGRYDNFSIVG